MIEEGSSWSNFACCMLSRAVVDDVCEVYVGTRRCCGAIFHRFFFIVLLLMLLNAALVFVMLVRMDLILIVKATI